MESTTGLAVAAAATILLLTGAIVVTHKKSSDNAHAQHLFPTLVTYGAVAVSVAMSLLSPRLTSTSVAAIFDSTATNALARTATGAALAVLALAVVFVVREKIKISALSGALIAYGAAGFLSALVNGQPLEMSLAYLYCLVAGVGLTSTWTIREALPIVRRCFRAYMWLSFVLMFVSPALAFWDVQGRELFGIKQLAGVTTHPNGLGTVAAIAVFVELFEPEGGKKAHRIHLFAALAVLILTQSRGAWVAGAIGIIFWMLGRAKGASVALAVPLMTMVMVGLIAFQNQVMSWLEAGTDARDLSTLNGRTLIWEQALKPVGSSPLVGHGPLVFDTRFRWEALGLADDAQHSNSHNQIIQTLVERGWLGLLVLALFVFLLLRAAWKQPLHYRGPALAIAMIFVSRFAVETPLYVSTASLNAALILLLVVLFTAKPVGVAESGSQGEVSEHRQVVSQGLRGRRVASGSRVAGGLDYWSGA